MDRQFKELCTPAKIYFVISIIAVLMALFKGIAIMAIVVKVVFVLFWTYILGFLCKKGYKAVSWFLVVMPYVLILIGGMEMMRLTGYQQRMSKQVALSPADYVMEGFNSKDNDKKK